jgi:hypothetical protein
MVLSACQLGIGTSTPSQRLDVQSAVMARNGGLGPHLALDWNNTSNYSHAIRTRHASGENTWNNAIDFSVWQTSQAAGAVGNKTIMSVTSASVGAGTTQPTDMLHVAGGNIFIDLAYLRHDTASLGAGMYLNDSCNAVCHVLEGPVRVMSQYGVILQQNMTSLFAASTAGCYSYVPMNVNSTTTLNGTVTVTSGVLNATGSTAYPLPNTYYVVLHNMAAPITTGVGTITASILSLNAVVSSSFYTVSYWRQKEAIEDLDDAECLGRVTRLEPKRFAYKHEPGSRGLGFCSAGRAPGGAPGRALHAA